LQSLYLWAFERQEPGAALHGCLNRGCRIVCRDESGIYGSFADELGSL
jgi:hypothetical protein